jgi:nucleoid-associated protein YgaU
MRTGGEISLNLKNALKSIKLHESTISMVLGAIVIVVLGVIVVNYFKSADQGLLDESPAVTETGQPKVERGMGDVTYTVSEGENLWDIAEIQYGSGYNWVDIAEANDLESPGLINTGDELLIPDVEPKQLTVEMPQDVNDEAEAISGGTYTVETGDNLWDIAVRAYGDGYRWVDIASENDLVNPNLIHKGNILTIPR